MPFWRRKRSSRHPDRRTTRSRSRGEQDAQKSLETHKWEARARTQRLPQERSPFASVNKEVLIVGLGTIGGEVLKGIAERADDVNSPKLKGVAERADDVNSPKDTPRLLHIGMPHVVNHPQVAEFISHERIQAIELEEDSTVPQASEFDKPHWDWLRALNYLPGETVQGRAAARTALFKHLRLGPKLSHLLSKLKSEFLSPTTHIFIVGSAYEIVGAGLIGDMVALMRAFLPNGQGAHFSAIVLTEPQDVIENEEPLYLAATLYELGRLGAKGRPRMVFTGVHTIQKLSYTPRNPNALLLDGVGVILAPPREGILQAVNLLWGSITSHGILTALDAASTGERLRAPHIQNIAHVSLLYSCALIQPVHLLVDLRTSALTNKVLDNLQDSSSFLRNLSAPLSPEEIDWALERGRTAGWLPTIRALYRADETDVFFSNLAQVLKEEKQELSKRIIRLTNAVNERARDAGDLHPSSNWLVAREWSQLDLEAQLDQMHNLIGMVANQIDSPPLYLVIAPERSGGSVKKVVASAMDRERMRTFVEHAQRVARRVVLDRLQIPHLRDPETLARFRGIKGGWKRLPQVWLQSIDKEIVQMENALNAQLICLNVPDEWDPLLGDMQKFDSDDPTFGMQALISDPIPIRNLQVIKQVQGDIREYLVHDVEILVFEIFGYDVSFLEKVPLALQNALSHYNTLERFFEFWHAGYTYQLRRKPEGEVFRSWEEMLQSFIEKYEFELRDHVARNQEAFDIFFLFLQQNVLEVFIPALSKARCWDEMLDQFIQEYDAQQSLIEEHAEYIWQHEEAVKNWGELDRIAKASQESLSADISDFRKLSLEDFVERYESDPSFAEAVSAHVQKHKEIWIEHLIRNMKRSGEEFAHYLSHVLRYIFSKKQEKEDGRPEL